METNSNPGRKRLLSYLGLGLILFAGAILIFIPDTPWPSLSPNAWLIFLILALIIIFVCLLLGCGLLMLGNLVLFKEIKGSLSLLALITLFWWFYFTFIGYAPAGILSSITVLSGLMGFVLTIILGGGLIIYLFYQDRAARLFAFTYLLATWSVVITIQRLGPDKLFQTILSEQAATKLWGLQIVFCFSFWVFIIAPASFLLHTARLIYLELTGEPLTN